MKIAGNRIISAPHTVVESVLQDGRQLVQAIPDFQMSVPLDKQRQRGTLTIQVGPMRGQYEGTFTISQPESAVWEIAFDGHSAQGIFDGHGRIHLTPQYEQTTIHYEIEIDVAGQLANLPSRLLHANVNAIVRRSLDGIERVLWPERFISELELDNESPLSLKTAVPGIILLFSTFLLIRIIRKRLK